MIYGVGVDILRIGRVEHLLARHGARFEKRLLHPDERTAYAARLTPAAYLAKALAAKEAFGKALGTGISGFAFHDVGVLREASGKPRLTFSAPLQHRLCALGIVRSHLSLSDEPDLVCAMVVLEAE